MSLRKKTCLQEVVLHFTVRVRNFRSLYIAFKTSFVVGFFFLEQFLTIFFTNLKRKTLIASSLQTESKKKILQILTIRLVIHSRIQRELFISDRESVFL